MLVHRRAADSRRLLGISRYKRRIRIAKVKSHLAKLPLAQLSASGSNQAYKIRSVPTRFLTAAACGLDGREDAENT